MEKLLCETSDQWCIELPTNGTELARIGRAQRHCVGSRIHAESCESGRSIIFSLYEKNKGVKHGFTFEFMRNTHALIQSEGFARLEPSDDLKKLAKQCFDLLLKPGH